LFLSRLTPVLGLVLVLATGSRAEMDPARLVSAARAQVGVTVSYDSSYRRLAYPGGDVPVETGVCTDVVVRALRAQGIDLQRLVHEDMKSAWAAYPKLWGLSRPDPNIDHRRVPNLRTYFKRRGWERSVPSGVTGFLAGDVVTWDLGGGLAHIGIVTDRKSPGGTPLVVHNIGAGAREEDVLKSWRMTGLYRLR
jgi:uncharacterized protein YijF (DUF1287 family)